MGVLKELLDVEGVVLRLGEGYFEFDHCCFVVVEVAVVRCREYGYYCGKLLFT
jgi:hypothetical protein